MKSKMNVVMHPLALLALTLFLTLSANPAWAIDRKLSFGVSGVVIAVKVKSGDRVKAGDVLAILDPTIFKARKRSADANVKASKLILELAEVKLTQMRDLFDALSTSQEEVEKAEIAHAHALATYEKARSSAEITGWRLQRTLLKSPFAGTVTEVAGYPGMVINKFAGSQTVIIVNDQ
ncbi:MAG: biotin/lipoyl-binding protein [Rhodospirillaceae bacterium]|nr:biotin/lipoyl-binding protein [Rhodospirillaceae bacterium]MBL6931015.1 biotin/lipoyl-binding protein [Rhodospirillales bacterium]MBL6942324.1 biotin/lipoyl-binding protein [Rhodospirillales bacterium]